MKPLADRIRPTTLDEVVGQRHLIGENGILRRIAKSGKIPNMVLFGPPGVGKTTVARILAGETDRKLYRLNGTTAGTGEIKDIVAELGTFAAPGGALVYLDEIQYFNKKQQQTLLEFMENGQITLIASTTENPYFYVYPALLSRSAVFEFYPLSEEDMRSAVLRAFSFTDIKEPPAEVVEHIAFACGGDVRKAINAVELLALSSGRDKVSLEDAKAVTGKSAVKYDRDGDSHYDILSAFQKSLRGSDPDAAVYYLARLIAAGDLPSICRRLAVTAAEDVGLAHPQAIAIVKACIDTALMVGLPEARIPLCEAVLLVATAPKSNSAVCAIDAALGRVYAGGTGEIPADLRDTHYAGAKKLGRGEGYKYPHSFKNSWVRQQYLPDEIKDEHFYEFGQNKLEQLSKEYWDRIKNGSKD